METIIAAFDDTQSAQSAVERLVQQGFSRSAVHLEASAAASAPAGSVQPHDDDFLSSIGDFFSNLFGGDEKSSDAGNYAETVRRGGTVVIVDAQNDAEATRAKGLLHAAGSVDVDERAQQWKSQGWDGFKPDAKPMTPDEMTVDRGTVLSVVQEDMKVGKRTVDTGAVRVVRRTIETPVSELVRLRQERAVIERRPVDRLATAADLAAFQDETIEVRETAEEAVVSKSARVVEEVVIGTATTEHTETVTGTVRRSDIDVERGDGLVSAGASTVRATASVVAASPSDRVTSGTDANPDPITGEPGFHPVGTGVGAALGGAAAGAATGTVVGPVGTVIGAAVGAVVGGIAGKGVAEKVDPTRPNAR